MASLQKIRNHGTLLIVVVGVAMLAFILGDFLSNSNSITHRNEQNVGIIAGNKISWMEFERTRDLLERVQKDGDKFMIPQADSTQITYTQYLQQRGIYLPQEINNEVVWEYYKQYYTYAEQAEKLGLAISEEEEEFLAQNIPFVPGDKIENSSMNFPLYLPEIVVKGVWLQQKYVSLLQNTLAVNAVEAEFAFNSRQHGMGAEYVMIPFDAIADSLVEVSEHDIQALYDKYKPQLKRESNRVLEYAVINYVPSDADRIQDSLDMINIAADFRTANDVDAMLREYESDEQFLGVKAYTADDVPALLKDFAFGADAKVGNYTEVLYDGKANMMARIMDINKAQKTVSLAILKRTIIPSDASKVETLHQYRALAQENTDLEAFEQAIREAGLMPQTITVQETTPQIGKLEGSRELIRAAFNTPEGKAINDAFECGDKAVIVAAVLEANDDKYVPLDKVRSYLQIEATNNAKAEYIAAQHPSIANLNEVAQAYGQSVQSIARVALSDQQPEPAVVGAIINLGENAISEPIKGNMGVYYVKTGVALNTNEQFNDEAKEAEKASLSNRLSTKFQQAIQHMSAETNSSLYDITKF